MSQYTTTTISQKERCEERKINQLHSFFFLFFFFLSETRAVSFSEDNITSMAAKVPGNKQLQLNPQIQGERLGKYHSFRWRKLPNHNNWLTLTIILNQLSRFAISWMKAVVRRVGHWFRSTVSLASPASSTNAATGTKLDGAFRSSAPTSVETTALIPAISASGTQPDREIVAGSTIFASIAITTRKRDGNGSCRWSSSPTSFKQWHGTKPAHARVGCFVAWRRILEIHPPPVLQHLQLRVRRRHLIGGRLAKLFWAGAWIDGDIPLIFPQQPLPDHSRIEALD